MIIRIIILFTFFVYSGVTCVTCSTGTDAHMMCSTKCIIFLISQAFISSLLTSVHMYVWVSQLYNLAITAVFPNKLVLAYQWQHPTLPPQAPVKMKSWDTEVECKKLSVAVRAYCMHAYLAIRHPLSKEASGV